MIRTIRKFFLDFLNTSVTHANVPFTTPSPVFVELLWSSSVAKVRMMFNDKLECKGCIMNLNLTLTIFVIG